jgi:hypothetical protein
MSLAALLALVTELMNRIIESRLSNVDILTFVNSRVKCEFLRGSLAAAMSLFRGLED